jgi:hypothetical protein
MVEDLDLGVSFVKDILSSPKPIFISAGIVRQIYSSAQRLGQPQIAASLYKLTQSEPTQSLHKYPVPSGTALTWFLRHLSSVFASCTKSGPASCGSLRAHSSGGSSRIHLYRGRKWVCKVMKCTIRHDLLFREPGPSSIFEVEANDDHEYGEDGEDDEEGSETAEGWDDLLLKDEDDSLTIEMDTDLD